MSTNTAPLPTQPRAEATPQNPDPTAVNTKNLFDRMRDEVQARHRNPPAVEHATAAPQNAAQLAYRWGTPVDLVQKLLAAETEIFLLQADIRTLTARLDLLQAK